VLFPVPYSLGGFPCLAALHEPGVEEPLELPCSPVAGEALVRVSLPGGLELSPWSVLTLRSRPSDRSDQFGVKPIRLLGEGTTPWSPPVVGFEVPFLDPAQALAVSLPEFVQAASAPSEFDGQPSGWVGSATVSPDGRSGRFEATSPSLGLVVDVRTGLDRVDLEMSLTNRSESSLGGVVAILCASSRGASPFPESGHARTWVVSESGPARLDALPNDEGDPLYVYREDISEPLTVLRSMDGAWVLGHGFEESMASGGNASSNGVCVHSRPDFGSLEPGQTVRRSGFLYLGPESGLSSSWQTPPEGPAAGLQLDAKVGPCLTN